jgi:Zn-dependent protease with chaperone function
MTAWPLRLLLWLYIPFLLLLCLFMAAMVALLLGAFTEWMCPLVFVAPLIGVLGLTLVQVLWSMRVLLSRPADQPRWEIGVAAEALEPALAWVAGIARKQGLWEPHEIRFAPDTIAHVYEDRHGRRILVLGGQIVAALSQEALAGVIAHELAHFTAGDTKLGRKAARRVGLMLQQEQDFRNRPATQLNPLVWLIRLYHWLFLLAWAAESRRQEYAADRHLVEQAGKDTAAVALLHITITDRLPWARLDSIAKSHAANNEPIDQIFAEHWRRARSIGPDEWDEACRKELKCKTRLFDTHPALRERLKAMGISAKRALKLLCRPQGPPARDLFPDWPLIEKVLTSELIAAYRELYWAKREMAQIMLGRPI